MQEGKSREAFRNTSLSSGASDPTLINFSVTLFQRGAVVVLGIADNQSQKVLGFICSFAMGLIYPVNLHKWLACFASVSSSIKSEECLPTS